MEDFIFRYNIFYFVVLIIVLPYSVYAERRKSRVNTYDTLFTTAILLFSFLVVAFREYDLAVDTIHYLRDFEIIKDSESLRDSLILIRNGGDPMFTIITYIATQIGSERFYIFLLAALYFLPIAFFIFKSTRDKRLLLLLAFFSIYSFKWMAVNTLRSGIAVSFALLFLFYYSDKNKRKAFLFAAVSLAFHLSTILIIGANYIAKRIKNIWVIYLALFLTSILAILGFGVNNIPLIAEFDRLSSYVRGHDNYEAGFSVTYWLYNILITLYFIFMNSRIRDSYYLQLGKIFMLISSVYFLCFNISFSDRIGVLSWVLIPIIISYPFLHYRVFDKFQNNILIIILFCFQLLAIVYLKR